MGITIFTWDDFPTLLARLEEDEKKGSFNFGWGINSKESKSYFSSLLGRRIHGGESIVECLAEIEEKLSSEKH